MTAAEKGNVEKMTGLFSKNAVEKMGLDKISSNNQTFAGVIQRGLKAGGAYRMEIIEQTTIPTGQRLAFVFRNEADFFRFDFDLRQEDGNWNIDAVASPQLAGILDSGTPETSPTVAEPVPSAPELPAPPGPKTKYDFKGTTISGGVLNGKAISLPKPPYPPLARAAKASGTVVVQVLVDENGNVVSAHAVSGHPLLRAASVAAARGAKFSPTKLSGQPVKVSGVIHYNFESPQ